MSILQTFKFIFSHPLSRNQRGAAYRRWLRWQIGSRISLGGTVVEFIGGTRLLAEQGMAGATGNIYCGLHECHDMGFVLHFLRKEDLFLDGGANIGSYTVLASGAANMLADTRLEAVLMELNGSGEAYGFDEQAIHRDMLNLGFKQCSYNVLTRELQMNAETSWYTGNNLYARNPKLAQNLVSSAQRYALIGMQI